MNIRPARLEEVPLLEAALAADEEKIPFPRTITYVAEVDGEVKAFASARLVWIVEPLKLLPNARKLPKNTQRRITYELARAVEGWIADPLRNRTGIRDYFCHVAKRGFQKLVEHWGLKRWYPKSRLYHKEL